MKTDKTLDTTVSDMSIHSKPTSRPTYGFYKRAGIALTGVAATLASYFVPTLAMAADKCKPENIIPPNGQSINSPGFKKYVCTTPTITVHIGETLDEAIRKSTPKEYDQTGQNEFYKQARAFVEGLGYSVNKPATREGEVPLCIPLTNCDPSTLGTEPAPPVIVETTLGDVIKYFKGMESHRGKPHYVKDIDWGKFGGLVTKEDHPYKRALYHQLMIGKEKRGIIDVYFKVEGKDKRIGTLRYDENKKIYEWHTNGEFDPELLNRVWRVSNFSARRGQVNVDVEQDVKALIYIGAGTYLAGGFAGMGLPSPFAPPSGGGSTPPTPPQPPPPGPGPGN